jgi:hypothetical protein
MFNAAKKLLAGLVTRQCSPGTPPRKALLNVEHLEDRLVPAITDMTALALHFPTPTQPTTLYLNFDGGSNLPGSGGTISAFTGTQQNIDDIVYQVSEMFAPFNVNVERMYGSGNYGKGPTTSGGPGPTTVFIGADATDVTPAGVKYTAGFTPSQFVDAPFPSDPSHRPHSNAFNLAYVDPDSNLSAGPWTVTESDTTIAESVAHEAGHTFGAAHVRTDGKADPAALLSEPVPDLMPYPVLGQYFVNQTFNITTDNFNASTGVTSLTGIFPDWQGSPITTQDSYTYLGAVLGYRQYDGAVHVVHNGDVDGYSYTFLTGITGYGGTLLSSPNYKLGTAATGNLVAGDSNVYEMTATSTESAVVGLAQNGGPWYNSLELVVYDQNGNFITSVDGPYNGNIATSVKVTAGQTYEFVVTTVGGTSNGAYTFQVSNPRIIRIPGGVGLLSLAPANLGMVANSLAHSAEAYSDFVTNAYQTYLGRTPGVSEVSGWVAAMQNGLSDEQVEAGFIGSAEYIANHGGPGAGWVTGMYQNLLGRTPAQSEVDAWVQQLNNGMSPSAVAYGFAASYERESQRVAADYLKYLGRAASQAEIDGWAMHFEQGYSNEDLIANFVGSAEYYADQGATPTLWLDAAYQDILNRQPGAGEVAGWLPLLGS